MKTLMVILFLLLLTSCNQGGGGTSSDFPLGIVPPGTTVTASSSEPNKAEITFDVAYVYNFGQKVIESDNSITLVVRNATNDRATSLAGNVLVSPFSYKGGTYPGVGGNCGDLLAKNSTCTLIVSFHPTDVETYVSSVILSYVAGSTSKISKLSLNGEGVKATLATSASNPYTFDSTAKDGTTDATITIENTGDYDAVSVSAAGLAAPFAFKGGTYPGTGGTCSTDLAQSATCTMVLQYTPTTLTTSTDTLNMSYFNGAAMATLALDVSGTGLSPASLTASSSANFGTVAVNSSALATVTLSNSGGYRASSLASSTITNTYYSYSGNVYPGGGGTCSTTLNGSSTCKLVLMYKPADISNSTDDIHLSYYTGNSTATVTISMVGKTPAGASFVESSPYSMGVCPAGSACKSTVSLSYTGFAGASLTDISGDLGSGANSIGFEGGGLFPGATGTCTGTLNSGTCSIVLLFSPTSMGTYSDTLNVSYNDGLDIKTLSLSLSAKTYYSDAKLQFGSISPPILNGSYSAIGNEIVTGVAIDDSGKSFVVGYTTGDIDGSGNVSASDIFVLGYDDSPDTEFLAIPSASISMAGNERSAGAGYDSRGYVIVAGDTDGSFDASNTGAAGTRDLTLTTFNASTGVYQDSTQLGSTTGDEEAYGLVVDTSWDDAYYVFGSTTGNVQGAPQTKTGSNKDALLVAFDWNTLALKRKNQISNQQVIATIADSVTGDEIFKAAALDLNGNICLAGTTSGGLKDTNAGNTDVFVTIFDESTRLFTQITQLGVTNLVNASYGTGTDDVGGLVIDSLNNIYVVGTTTGTMNGATNSGNTDIFVSKFLNDGTYVKSYQPILGSKGSGTEVVTGASIDRFNNIYITGHTDGCLTCTGSQTSGGGQDIFIAKFATENGGFEFFQDRTPNASGNQYSATKNSGVVSSSNNIYMAGYTDASYGETNDITNDAFLRVKNYSAFTTTPEAWLSYNQKNSSDVEVFALGSTAAGGAGIDITVDLHYIGDGQALTVSSSSLSSNPIAGEINFKGGSFPGTGGTCATGAMSSSCQMVLNFTPSTVATYTGNLDINYTTISGTTKVSSLSLSGDGI